MFPNAPIVEAILDIRAKLPEGINLDTLEAFQNSIKDRFPEKKKQYSFGAELKFSPGEPSSLQETLNKPIGYLFKSSAKQKIVQARLNGFTLNKLKPYEEWEVFCKEGRELWKLYSNMFKPVKVERIALRYINRIEIPLPLKEFEEYILTIPQIAPKLSTKLSTKVMERFFMQFVVPNIDIEANAIITVTTEKPVDDKLPLIFDIDAYRDTAYVDTQEKIWDDFENLHKFKNDIFFDSITDKTKELFK